MKKYIIPLILLGMCACSSINQKNSGQIENFINKKVEAKATIGNLPHLTIKQEIDYNLKIETAKNENELETILQEAKKINTIEK